MIPQKEFKVSSWSSLIRFSIDPLIKVSYFSLVFVPVLAIVINLWNFMLDKFGSHNFAGNAAAIEGLAAFRLDMPFGLFMTYTSVLIYILTNIMLQIFCPSKVKEHRSYHRYLGFLSNQYLLEMSWRKRIAADIRQNGRMEQKVALDDEDMKRLNQEFNLASAESTIGKAVQLSRFSQFLHEKLPIIWTQDNYSHKWIRYTLLLLYLFSFLLMAVVLFIYTPLVVFAII